MAFSAQHTKFKKKYTLVITSGNIGQRNIVLIISVNLKWRRLTM